MTDIKFLSDNRLVCANRQDAALYLVEIDLAGKTWKILDRLVCTFNGKPFHFDLFCVGENTVYGVELTNRIAAISIDANQLIPRTCVQIEKQGSYHGISRYGNYLILSGRDPHKKLTLYDMERLKTKVVILPGMETKNIKQTIILPDNRLLTILSDGNPTSKSSSSYDAHIAIFQFEPIRLLMSKKIPDSHVDDVCVHENLIYVTCQSGSGGKILVFDMSLDLIETIPVEPFPHGIDVRNDVIAYTSYKNSSVCLINR